MCYQVFAFRDKQYSELRLRYIFSIYSLSKGSQKCSVIGSESGCKQLKLLTILNFLIFGKEIDFYTYLSKITESCNNLLSVLNHH